MHARAVKNLEEKIKCVEEGHEKLVSLRASASSPISDSPLPCIHRH